MSAAARIALLLLLPMVAVLQLGCGSGDGKVEVEGTANWNGAPITDGYVELHPVNETGQIDGAEIVNGKFTIRTHEGEKIARVTARRKIGETPATERIPNPEPIYHQFIPPEFNSSSTLNVSVSSGKPVQLDIQGTEVEPNRDGSSGQGENRQQEDYDRAREGSGSGR